jgi:hypothetical protein
VLITFSPTIVGAETATLNINGNANGSVNLTGNGAVVLSIQGTGIISGAGVIKH